VAVGSSWSSPDILFLEDHAGICRKSPRYNGQRGEKNGTSAVAGW
jgi:hypothetical protein